MTELSHQPVQPHSERPLCAWCDCGVEAEGRHRHGRELLAQGRARLRTFTRPVRVDEAVRGPWYPTDPGEVGLRWPDPAPWDLVVGLLVA